MIINSKKILQFKYIMFFIFLALIGTFLFFYPRKSYSEFQKKEYTKNKAIQIVSLDSNDPNWLKYKIIINQDEEKINKGKEYSVKNIFDNLEIDSKTIQFYSKKVIKWDVEDIVTYHVPDATKVEITYKVRVLDSEKKFNNRVELLNYYDDLSKDKEEDTAEVKENIHSFKKSGESTTKDIYIGIGSLDNIYRSSSDVWPEGLDLSIQLLADGEIVPGKTTVLNKDNQYFLFSDMPKYKDDGETEIVYSIADITLDDFDISVVASGDNSTFWLNLSQKLYTISGSVTWNTDSSLFFENYSELSAGILTCNYGTDNWNFGKEIKYGDTNYEFTEVPKYYYTQEGKIPLQLKFESVNLTSGEDAIPAWNSVIDGYNLSLTYNGFYDFIIAHTDSSLYDNESYSFNYNYIMLHDNSYYFYANEYSGTITATVGTISEDNGVISYTDTGVMDLEFDRGICNFQLNKNSFIRISDVPRGIEISLDLDYPYEYAYDADVYVLEDNLKKVASSSEYSEYYSFYDDGHGVNFDIRSSIFDFSSFGVLIDGKLKTRNMIISNEVHGDMANINNEFDYRLDFSGLSDTIDIPVTYGTISSDGIYTPTRESSLPGGGDLSFKLKHNEYISIPVPADRNSFDNFRLWQVDDASNPDYVEYVTNIEVLDDQHQPIDSNFFYDMSLDENSKFVGFSIVSHSYDGDYYDEDFTLRDVEVHFTNTRDSAGGGAYTGVITNIKFYITLLISVMIIGICFIISKRKINKKRKEKNIYEKEIV